MLYALFIGLGSYRDPRIKGSEGAAGDADAMCAAVHRSLPRAADGELTLLTNERATKGAIAALLTEEVPRSITSSDTVLVYFAGAGCLELAWAGAEPSMLLPCNDADFHDLRTGSLDMVTEISAWTRRLGAGLVALILDASFAGNGASRSFEGPAYHATIRTRSRRRSRWSTLPLGPQCALIAACGDEQGAEERDGRGAFTAAVVNALEEQRAAPATTVSAAALHARATAALGRAGERSQMPSLHGDAAQRALFRADVAGAQWGASPLA